MVAARAVASNNTALAFVRVEKIPATANAAERLTPRRVSRSWSRRRASDNRLQTVPSLTRSSRAALDSLFASENIKIIRTPVQAPNANAHVERWVGSVRRECLDRLLIVGRRQLEHVVRVYVRHYNRGRPHRALDLRPPDPSTRSSVRADSKPQDLRVRRRDLLGSLIHEYNVAAAA